MALFLITLLSYLAGLLGYRPSPNSLKEPPFTLKKHILQIKLTLLLGVSLIFIFLFVSNFNFTTIKKETLFLFGLNNLISTPLLLPVQIISHLFIHANFLHLAMNLAAMALMSAYERRVGSRRFLAVFAVSCISSTLAILFYSSPIIICGISGGISGLAAAYFTDYKDITVKQWLGGVISFTLLAIIFTYNGKNNIYSDVNTQTDYYGHILGAVGAIIYCRIQKESRRPT